MRMDSVLTRRYFFAAMRRSAEQWPKSFKEAYCARFKCAPEKFERDAAARCCYPHARPLLPLLLLLRTRVAQGAMFVIQRAGASRCRADLLIAVDEYRSWIRLSGGWMAQMLRLRISSRRLRGLEGILFPPRTVEEFKAKISRRSPGRAAPQPVGRPVAEAHHSSTRRGN
jgi:hypothetical protein